MIEILGLTLALLTILFVAYPLLKKPQRKLGFAANHQGEDLVARKHEIYAAVRDIDFDYRMGKLSEEDYNSLREQYKQEAVKVMQALDRMSGRGQKSVPHVDAAKSEAAFCHMCGAPAQRADAFCGACGAHLT
jgi:hypothetical protein